MKNGDERRLDGTEVRLKEVTHSENEGVTTVQVVLLSSRKTKVFSPLTNGVTDFHRVHVERLG